MDLVRYYQHQGVRQRMTEFLGGRSLREATAVLLRRCDVEGFQDLRPRPPSALATFLDQGQELCRSLWDRASLLVHVDIDHANHDFPAEALLHPRRSFALMEPVVAALEELLAADGISPLHLLSGRGHHFVWRVPLDGPVVDQLAALGRVPERLRAAYDRPRPPSDLAVTARAGLAFAGLGLVIEHLLLRVQARASTRCPVPVALTDVAPGGGERGRELVSLDISEYGDPLHTRLTRVPFSAYLKPWGKPGLFAPGDEGRRPLLVMIPHHEMDVEACIETMRDLPAAEALARRTSTAIPLAEDGTGRLLAGYRRSELARFHGYFHEAEHDPPGRWPQTYDALDPATLPPCVADGLRRPNDWLLRPEGIRSLVAALWGLGWHPRHIAGLVRSRYERDHGWGRRWHHYDPALRADFYVRLFAGQIATGRDELIDFNCRSEREKGLCARPHGCDLQPLRASALRRRWS